jgi:hypothetical protein
MVPLIDLWVATLLPADVFDVTFEVVTIDDEGQAIRSAPIDGLRFARGFVVASTRELWWEDASDRALQGVVAHSIVACVHRATAETVVPDPPAHPVSDADLRRLLPHVGRTYPAVEWRAVQERPEARSPLHAYLLALGLLTT